MVKYNTTSMLLLHMQDLNSLTRYKYFYINTHRLKEGDLTATYRINRPPKAAMTNRRRGKESDHMHGRSCVCWFLGIMLQRVLLFYVMRSRA